MYCRYYIRSAVVRRGHRLGDVGADAAIVAACAEALDFLGDMQSRLLIRLVKLELANCVRLFFFFNLI